MFLKRGSRGEGVLRVQQVLVDFSMFSGRLDAVFGSSTEDAVVKFQLAHKLDADGVVGPKTAAAMGLVQEQQQAFPIKAPRGLKQITEVFGDPLQPGYWDAYCDFCPTPPELNHVFKYTRNAFTPERQHGFYCNKLIIIPVSRVLSDIVRQGFANHLETFDGCHNVRYKRGTEKLSTHAWGIALDFNASDNPLGAEPKISRDVVDCFERHGFVWGGRWKRKDGMHVQYAKDY